MKAGELMKKRTEVAERREQAQGMQGLVIRMQSQIKKALPSTITPERFTRIVLTALSSNPKLQQCTPGSFLGAMMQAAQLGLEPNTPTGQAYLIPYKNVCTFQLGYRGLIALAYRTGAVKSIEAHEVYENDEFEYEYGLEPKLKHKPAFKNRGQVIAYYAVVHMKDGGYCFEVMSRDDVEAFAKAKSMGYGRGPWQTDFDAMAKKTLVKKVLKYAPISTDFMRAVSTDDTVKDVSPDDDMSDVIDLPAEDVTVEDVPEGVDPETGEIKK